MHYNNYSAYKIYFTSEKEGSKELGCGSDSAVTGYAKYKKKLSWSRAEPLVSFFVF